MDLPLSRATLMESGAGGRDIPLRAYPLDKAAASLAGKHCLLKLLRPPNELNPCTA